MSLQKTKLKRFRNRDLTEIAELLDKIGTEVDQPSYVENDPVCFMHAFGEKHDQEIAGFFAAIMAWGRRDIVINKVGELLKIMNYRPYDFIRSLRSDSSSLFQTFKHRTFKPSDVFWICQGLHQIYGEYDDFESFWKSVYYQSISERRLLISVFHDRFFEGIPEAPIRSRKHIANNAKGSSCKRIYLFLKWCLRRNSHVDLGIWDFLPLSELMIPLDVHVGRQARALGLLTRWQHDWRSVVQLTQHLKLLDAQDPAKYDFSLFGLGVMDFEIPDHLIRNPKALKI